jgi:hypothetical protein
MKGDSISAVRMEKYKRCAAGIDRNYLLWKADLPPDQVGSADQITKAMGAVTAPPFRREGHTKHPIADHPFHVANGFWKTRGGPFRWLTLHKILFATYLRRFLMRCSARRPRKGFGAPCSASHFLFLVLIPS